MPSQVLKANSLMHTSMLEGTTSLEENSLIPNTFCKYADLGEDAM